MRSHVAIVFFSFALCIPCFGGASGGDFAPKILPEHVKLIKGFRSSPNLAPNLSAPDLRMRAPKIAAGRQTAESGICGHIRVAPAPKNVDPKIIIPVPERNVSRMPVHKGLPACQ